MQSTSVSWLRFVWFAISFCGFSRANPPEVLFTSPLAVAPGKSVEVNFHGNELADAVGLWTGFPGKANLLSADPTKNSSLAQFSIAVPDHVSVGVYGARLTTLRGVSAPVMILLDDLVSVQEEGEHRSVASAQELHPPTAVDGAGDGVSSDFYCFVGQAGQWYSIEVVASRLGYAFDPRVRVLDETGSEIAAADDSPGLNGDCHIRFQVNKTDKFFVEVVDAAYSSSARHKYRLRIGDFPLISTPYPLAINVDEQLSKAFANPKRFRAIGFCGVDDSPVPPSLVELNSLSSGSIVPIATRNHSSGGSAFAKLAVSALPNVGFVEHQPNGRLETALAVEVPASVHGIIREPNQTLYYKLNLSVGQRIKLRGITRSLGSPTDLFVKVLAPDGKLLVSNDDSGLDDAVVDFIAEQSGAYVFTAQETQCRFGSQFSFRIEVTSRLADFDLSSSADRVIVGQGGVGLMPIACQRHEYDGPIRLRIEDSSAPFRLEDNVIEAGMNSTLLQFIPDAQVQPGVLHMLRIVGESDSNGLKLSKYLNVVESVRKQYPSLPYPPVETCDRVAVAVALPLADFFGLRLASKEVLFPRVVGETYFTTFCTDRIHGFKDAIDLEVVGLPPGFKVSGHERPVGNSQNSEYRFALQGPKMSQTGSHEIEVRGTGTFQGQLKQVRLKGIPLHVVEPLIVSLEIVPAKHELGELTLRANAKRFVPRDGGDRKEIRCNWKTRPSWLTGPNTFVIGAGKNEAVVVMKRESKDGSSETADFTHAAVGQLAIVAETTVEGQPVKVESKPIEIERLP